MSRGTHPVVALLLEVAFLLSMFLLGSWLLTPGDDGTGRHEGPDSLSASPS
jgi:hypothetical protein